MPADGISCSVQTDTLIQIYQIQRKGGSMKLGFIGSGNMAKAMMRGIIKSGLLPADEIMASDLSAANLEATKTSLNVNVTNDNLSVAACDIVVLSVKPQYYADVIHQIAPCVKESTLIVTIAPGMTMEKVCGLFGREIKLVRTMPNTSAMVGEGMTAACANQKVTPEEMDYVCSLLKGFGKCAVVSESMMDAVVAISGSSPAYVDIMIEALADGAVMEGMPRALAYQFAAQAVLGSAKMVLETGKHPAELKDMVCSPAGTTIEAVRVLEEKGFRSSLIEAVSACVQKARSM